VALDGGKIACTDESVRSKKTKHSVQEKRKVEEGTTEMAFVAGFAIIAVFAV
jgi:hypothetical protein